MTNKFNFDDSLSSEMALPPTIDSIAALNASYATLVKVLNKRVPGLANEVLGALDDLYVGNKDMPARFAIAQLAATVRVISNSNE